MSKEQLRRQNRIVIALVVVLIIVGLSIHQYFNYALKPVDADSKQRVTVVVPKGATDHSVAVLMKKHHLVRSQFVFDYYLQTHKTNGIKAGKFRLKRSSSIPELVMTLQENQAAKKQ
ncbi:endolytic transglycosylase MltG [Limosilactobacillus sp.]|uniref:endolytic transglycosylase MltG n=1 Tax=Limosilactobacillus sp. TaxID=2773925 RepID=UPI0025BA0FF3|nr:endolytic transglycosylase MltG [Limosilactobacillus sp.]MCH3923077.1 hypothetical protein [Limosilactobacillus sp.]MCH3927760.1 hypothetical protein [Limosilactobacillus sp.]